MKTKWENYLETIKCFDDRLEFTPPWSVINDIEKEDTDKRVTALLILQTGKISMRRRKDRTSSYFFIYPDFNEFLKGDEDAAKASVYGREPFILSVGVLDGDYKEFARKTVRIGKKQKTK